MFGCVYAQQDLIKTVTQQAVEIDSLTKATIAKRDSIMLLKNQNDSIKNALEDSIKVSKKLQGKIDSLSKVTTAYEESIKKYKADSTNQGNELKDLKKENKDLKEYEAGMKTHKDLLQSKTDSISDLNSTISEKDKQLAAIRQESIQAAIKEKESGKNEILSIITNNYKKLSFDDLIKSTSRLSAQNDLRILGSSSDIKPILDDLENYFSAMVALEKKYDAALIKEAQQKLSSITQKSDSRVGNLIEKVENYQAFHEGLIEMLGKIKKLDDREVVAGMGEVNFQKKHYKILSEITKYIFDYDFNFSDYPYLSDIVLEVIKRKQPNPDADISDLLKKL